MSIIQKGAIYDGKINCYRQQEQMFVKVWTNYTFCSSIGGDELRHNKRIICLFLCDIAYEMIERSGDMEFKLHSEYAPTGDQPQAIEELVKGFQEGKQFQTLLGVTGSGKTFTMANVIAALNKPTLIISHNKTLAGQLYGEFKEFFPENAVEYFVSYYAMGKTPQYTVV